MKSHSRAALIAFLLLIPMAVLAGSIVFEITIIEKFLKSFLTNDGSQPNILGRIYMIISLLALPVALGISLWPIIKKDAEGKRHFYWLNIIVALLVLVLMTPTWGGLLEEVYRCEILNIPNCD